MHCTGLALEQGSAGLDAAKGTWGKEKLRVPTATATAEGAKARPRKAAPVPGIPTKGTTIHTLVTSNGSPYLNFQNRIMCALPFPCCCCMCGLTPAHAARHSSTAHAQREGMHHHDCLPQKMG